MTEFLAGCTSVTFRDWYSLLQTEVAVVLAGALYTLSWQAFGSDGVWSHSLESVRGNRMW